MRVYSLLLFFWGLSAAFGFAIRNVYYVNATGGGSDDMPSAGTSLIQVKPSEKTSDKPKRIPDNFPQTPDLHKSVGSKALSDFLIKFPKKRVRRELFSEEALVREIEDLMMRSGSDFERPRPERTLIQAPLFQGKSCPPGLKLDRARKKCRGPW